MAKGTTMFGIIFGLILVGGAFFMGWFYASDWQFSDDPQQLTPVIDGIIGKQEWKRSSYNNIPFYLDVDNELDTLVNKSNVDGWNYLSVAEDEDFYYFAVDLCSDRTNNMDGEWFSAHLANRLPDAEYSKLAFYALEDYGYEYLFYNVSEDSVFDNDYYMYGGSSDYYDIPIVPDYDSMEVFRGNTTGDMYDFWTDYDDLNITATSKYYVNDTHWLSGQFLDIHFGIDVFEKFPDVNVTAFTSSLSDMELRLVLKSNLTADPMHSSEADEFYCSVTEHGGIPGDMNADGFLNYTQVLPFSADIVSHKTVDLNYSRINPSTGMFYFSIHCWNEVNASYPTNFELQIDKLSLKFRTQSLGSVIGTTIGSGNYDIAYSYGPSENCPEDHRMFEFKIAKAEFPVLENDLLYLNIAGYGTMAMMGTNFWMHPIYGYPAPPLYSSIIDKGQFLTLDMSIT